MTKRIFDFTAALVGLLLLSPLFLLVGIWIKLDSRGPVFFRQPRVGKDGVMFDIVKFRTMFDEAHDGLLTIGHDRRITPAGRFLRRHKLDEFPQLFNVIAGTMSLVGPRPEVPRYVDCYPPEVRSVVLSVAPGITDWASIYYKEENSLLSRSSNPEAAYLETILPAKLKYNLRYVHERSFWNDVRIIFTTLATLVR
ncbi:sugar transferase [Massilia sp. TSP1-1-2]|uniref:sugar transferase n=1 Tax=unclassified Massilia TaxID=2609279 RepID=UPI003CF6AC37